MSRYTPNFRGFIAVLLWSILLIMVLPSAHAQTLATADQQANSASLNAGNNQAITVTSAPNSPYTFGELDQRVHTNQAMSAPAVIGGTAPASGGCPAIEGWSASVVVANGGKSTAIELPGCMLNQLADRVGRLTTNPDGTWDWKSKMQLEAWCAFAPYKLVLERSGRYTCEETIEARRAAQPQTQKVSSAPTDPYVIARMQKQGKLAY